MRANSKVMYIIIFTYITHRTKHGQCVNKETKYTNTRTRCVTNREAFTFTNSKSKSFQELLHQKKNGSKIPNTEKFNQFVVESFVHML